MPVSCSFALNGQTTTVLQCAGVGDFIAFSGDKEGRDNPAAVAKQDVGPLPPGRYYIFDRESGGHLGILRDIIARYISSNRNEWFSLYRDDGKIDDETFVDGVRRGSFRLHPIGPLRLSEGCITLTRKEDFDKLRDALKATDKIAVPNTSLKAYGTVDVR